MGLDLGRHSLAGRLQPDAAVEVVGDRSDDHDDDTAAKSQFTRTLRNGSVEHVEADVGVKSGSVCPKSTRWVKRIQSRHWLRHADTRDQGEQQATHDTHQTGAPADQLLK